MVNHERPDQAAGKLIAVTGIDGAGKTTLAASLHAALDHSGHDAILVGKHTTEIPMSAELSEYAGSLNAVIYRRKASVSAACGDHYWLFALAAWYSLQDQLIIQPALRAGTHVILDNSHHKILARYAVNPECPPRLARQVFAHLTPPDIVLFSSSPREALRRKQAFSSLEAGHTDQRRRHSSSTRTASPRNCASRPLTRPGCPSTSPARTGRRAERGPQSAGRPPRPPVRLTAPFGYRLGKVSRTREAGTGKQYLWHGVTWATGAATVLLADTTSGRPRLH